MNCPGSVHISATLEDKPSAAAKEGTGAHLLLEIALAKRVLPDTMIGEVLATKDGEVTVTEDMAMAVRYAYDLIVEKERECFGRVFSERQVEVVEGVKGTVDCAIVSLEGDRLYVIDYKHGSGTLVRAEDNEQMMLYAYGVVKSLGLVGIKSVEMTIIQPRCERASAKHSSDVKDFAEVEAFCMRAAEQRKRIIAGDKTLCDGPWCKKGFCPALKQKVCPKITARTTEGLNTIGAAVLAKTPDPMALDAGQLARVLDVKSAVEDFFEACEKRALALAEDGQNIPGYSLKEKLGNREWKDEKSVVEVFGEAAYEKKLKSPTQLDKIDKTKVAELTERNTTGFKLVKTN